jgi:hypothetical protein
MHTMQARSVHTCCSYTVLQLMQDPAGQQNKTGRELWPWLAMQQAAPQGMDVVIHCGLTVMAPACCDVHVQTTFGGSSKLFIANITISNACAMLTTRLPAQMSWLGNSNAGAFQGHGPWWSCAWGVPAAEATPQQ